jgi:hypothetical protein
MAVREGRTHDLYNLGATKQFQATLETRDNVPIGQLYAPWWNPPFYALPFALLARLSFHWALGLWLSINIICTATAVWILCSMLPAKTRWQTWALAPMLVALSMPFMATITHGQNSGTSLLIVTVAVWFWRQGRGLAAGMVAGLLCYKPQLAVVFAAIMILDLGWRAAAGVFITGAALLLINLAVMPGTISDFLHQVPANLSYVQEQSIYPWTRHVTFKAFWRLLIQGEAIEKTRAIVTVLSAIGIAAFGTILVRTAIKNRGCAANRDRLVAATIAVTPLLMPFYFDYDLLLLAVPAMLLAVEFIGSTDNQKTQLDTCLIGLLAILYTLLMFNPDIAEATRLNPAVPILAALGLLMIWRVNAAPISQTPIPIPQVA